jgi:predicted membrane-bound spermidine synthase
LTSFQGILPESINKRIIFAGIFLISLSGLVLEIAITRIFSAAIWYHFAFVAVAVALVGLGSSGLLVHYRLKKIKENWAGDLTILSCLGITTVIPITLFVMHSLASQLVYLPLFMLMFAIPFFFVGIVISVAFSAFAHIAGRLYSSDLIGASVGALSVILLLSMVGGEGTALVVGLIASVCATVFSFATKSKKKILTSFAFIGFASLLLLANETTQAFSIPTDPTANKDLPIFLRENPGSHIANTKWNSFSRIDVVEGISGDCIPAKDPRNPSQCAEEGLVAKIFIDGGAGTNVISWDGNPDSRKELSSWMQYLPFKMKDNPKVLIIGSGGGRDVVAALASGSKDVTAVEINPIIFETVTSYGNKAGNLYTHQYVNAHVDEGRSFVSRSQEKYDIIYIPFVDTWASVSSGGLGVSENFLYTIEGFQEYYDHLNDDGKIIAVRWLIDSPRFVSTFSELLERNGHPKSDLDKHLLIVSSDSVEEDPSVTMVIFSKSPFKESEVQFLSDSFEKNDYKPILIPNSIALEPYSDFLKGKLSNEEFYALFPNKMHYVTDDSPFFLSFEKPIPKILEILIYISVAIVASFLIGPYALLKKDNTEKSELRTGIVALYFAALGMGFILIELALLQKLILLLGNPTMTFAVLLFTILIASGIGSFISSRLVKSNTRNLTFLIMGVIAIGLVYAATLPHVIYSMISEPFEAKALLSVGLLFPIGILMGMPLPTAMRLIKSYTPRHIPWMWAINGAFSVLGAILSVVIGILYGASYAMTLGALIYIIALVTASYWKKKTIEIQPST